MLMAKKLWVVKLGMLTPGGISLGILVLVGKDMVRGQHDSLGAGKLGMDFLLG